MIRVVIVEDELILRKGLVLSVNWEALGAVIVGEGDNGRRGLETILKQVRQKPGGGHAGLAVEQTDTGVNNYYAARALTEIKERYHQKLSLDMLARQLGVSASYLSQKFKEETNCTFLDFLNQYRLRKAVQLLSTGKYRIAEVSEQVGFTNYKHFHAVFKKYTDLTPSEFLKNQSCIIVGNIQMDRFFPEETEKRSEAE